MLAPNFKFDLPMVNCRKKYSKKLILVGIVVWFRPEKIRITVAPLKTYNSRYRHGHGWSGHHHLHVTHLGHRFIVNDILHSIAPSVINDLRDWRRRRWWLLERERLGAQGRYSPAKSRHSLKRNIMTKNETELHVIDCWGIIRNTFPTNRGQAERCVNPILSGILGD